MKREIRYSPGLELRSDGGTAKIRGYAAIFNSLSVDLGGFREKIARGAFANSLSNDVRALVDHDPSRIIGRSKAGTLAMREDAHGLAVTITPPDTSVGRDVVESIRRGDLDQMSFGFRTITDNWHRENGENIRELKAVELFDVSVVSFPAYEGTSVGVRSFWPDGLPEEITQKIKLPSSEERERLRLQVELLRRL
jgi:Escherichia/Staphylococcus phage prohead protease